MEFQNKLETHYPILHCIFAFEVRKTHTNSRIVQLNKIIKILNTDFFYKCQNHMSAGECVLGMRGLIGWDSLGRVHTFLHRCRQCCRKMVHVEFKSQKSHTC